MGKISSAYFNVSNGLRQGGVLSTKLFAIYVDDLSQDLAMCKSGCYTDDQCINHVMYVDDNCLLHGTKCYCSATYVRCVF